MSARYTFDSRLQATLDAQRRARTEALRDVGFIWQGQAALLTPVDTGFMRASLAVAVEDERSTHTATAQPGGQMVSYTTPAVGAGVLALGSHAEYAAAVHEDLSARRRVGGPKFIEKPLSENGAAWIDYVAKKIAEATP